MKIEKRFFLMTADSASMSFAGSEPVFSHGA
jgi:hypothetical protein